MRKLTSICLGLIVTLSAQTLFAADNYEVDPVHSSIIFRIGHMNVGQVYGRFNDFSGKITLGESADDASFEMNIVPASVDTNNAKRDEHLRSPDFFSVKEFPVITFKSTSVEDATRVGSYLITGDLTLHGQTKRISIILNTIGGPTKGSDGKTRIGLAGEFSIKRSDFGMDYGMGNIGDDVTILIAVEALR